MEQDKDNKIDSVTVLSVEPTTPHIKAVYEAGKYMLVDSLSTGKEFCKSMISISTGGIPLYLGILTFILPKEYILGKSAGWLIALPAIGFLVTTLIFAAGYLPLNNRLSLDNIDEIESVRERIIRYRTIFTYLGLFLFSISTLGSIWAVIVNIGVR